MTKRTFEIIEVKTRPGMRSRGVLRAGALTLPVAIGRSGIKANKREGDGATTRGQYRLKRLWWRADRGPPPHTGLALRRIKPDDAWSEDPRDRHYNRPFRIGAMIPGDRLWRADHLYDLIIEVDHNQRPRIAGRGSAVFIHAARPGFPPTAGCVALESKALRRLVTWCGNTTKIIIH
ncbi:MAG: L,D-transpeptidase family protein [Rhizobiales bacterium]|nr:L,D-transpeptidase family protein [Hyphomicrobiales bacterium]